jgi:hypothetical protein
MIPVKSSLIAAIGFEPATNPTDPSAKPADSNFGTLIVKMKSGQTYRYPGVAKQIHDNMLAADSVGKFFGSQIKGRYLHTQDRGETL